MSIEKILENIDKKLKDILVENIDIKEEIFFKEIEKAKKHIHLALFNLTT